MQTRIFGMLDATWFRRTVLALYTVGLAGVIAAYIGISLLSVQTSVYLRGPETLEKGRPNAVRGVVLDAQKGQFRRDVEGTFRLRPMPPDATTETSSQGPVSFPLGSARPNSRGLLHTQLTLPDDVPTGPSTLVFRADGPGIEPFEAETAIEVVARDSAPPSWPDRTPRIGDETRRERLEEGPVLESRGDLRVDILPLDGEFARGLTNRVYLRTYDRSTGEPVSANVQFESVEGMGRWGLKSELPETVSTDEMGIARIEWEPAGGQKWQLVARERLGDAIDRERERRTGRATIHAHTVAAQFVTRLESPLLVESRPVRGDVRSLFRSNDVYIDLIRGDEWLTATETSLQSREASFALQTPEFDDEQWLYCIQVYSGLYTIGHAWDVARAVEASGRNASAHRRALDRTVAWIAEHRDDPYFEHLDGERVFDEETTYGANEMEGWLRAYLEAIPRQFESSQTLLNPQKADRRALEAWKDRVQRDLMLPIVLALIIALLFVLHAVVTGMLEDRAHRETLRDLDVEMELDGALPDDEMLSAEATERRARWRRYVLIAIVVATFVLFGLGLLQMLSYM
jgi:hypothetical protein